MAEAEEWRDVPGYEGRYRVSSLGRVRSLLGRGRLLRFGIDRYGYLGVVLCKPDVPRKSLKVHHLVLWALTGPKPAPDSQTRHLNDVKTDNRHSNLKWGTPLENGRDATRNRRRPVGSACPHSRLSADQVLAIRAEFAHGPNSNNKKRLALKFGVSRAAIKQIVDRNVWKHV